MKRYLAISGLAVVALLFAALLTAMVPAPREVAKELLGIGGRPASEWQMLQRLNGTATPYQLPDAGWAGFSGSGIQCLRGFTPGDTLKFSPNADVWVCGGSLDAGCQIGSTAPLDPNSGDYAAANTGYYLTLPDYTAAAATCSGVGCQTFTYYGTAAAFSNMLTGYRLCIVPTTGSVAFPVEVMR